MKPGHLLIDRVIQSGRIDAAAEQHIVEALRRFDRDDSDGVGLLRYLGIPTTAAKRRQAARDYWLSVSSDILGGNSAHERASRLAAAADRFERRIWPIWSSLDNPPAHATEADGALFFARKAAPFPESPKQFSRILDT